MYKINILLKQKQKLFHTQDLALLWNIQNKNTLYTTIKRYVQKSVLVSVYKGLYSTVPMKDVSPHQLGASILHGYSYISCETILVKHSIIFQQTDQFTFISDTSRRFSIGGYDFLTRQLADRFLYNRIGITERDFVWFADSSRAVADTLYFQPKFHFDNPKAINWKTVQVIQKEVGYL